MRLGGRARFVASAVFALALAAPGSAAAATLTSTSPPAISGTAQQGQTLTESHGTYQNAGTPVTPQSYAYQWQRCNGNASSCTAITGATNQTYTLTAADVGQRIRVLETAYTGANKTGTASSPTSSALTATVSAAPPSPPPTIGATTGNTTAIGTKTGTLHGVVKTSGQAVTWQFQFGQTANYNKGTPVQTISAGKGDVSVSWKLLKLRPNTLYHYRLVVIRTVSGTPTTTYGQDKTFTTKATGKLRLLSRNLKVTGRSVPIPLNCESALTCVTRITITTGTSVGGTTGVTPAICVSKVVRLGPGKTKTFTGKLTTGCKALLSKASNHKLAAKLTTRPRTGQAGVIKRITLFF